MTRTQRKFLKRVERSFTRCKEPASKIVLFLCATVRDLDARLAERKIPGHVARMIEVMLERVSAGDSPKSVCADYAFEWGHGPDLAPLVKLVRLREAVRAWRAAREESENEEARATDAVLKALKSAGGGRR